MAARYQETRDQSGELLRLIIPHMAKHPAPFTPLNFALWYEYLAGLNPPLRDAVDALIAKGDALDDQNASALHAKFIASRDAEAAERLQSELLRVLRSVTETAASVGTEVSQYQDSVARLDSEIRGSDCPAGLESAIHTLLHNTTQMRESVSTLKGRLDASGDEVTALKRELERVQGEASVDPLTSLKNRRGLERALDEIRAEGRDALAGCCLAMFDIDHFKRVNDTHGHLLGDKVIRATAQVLKAAVKGRDIVARWGGEEFLVLLPETPLAGAKSLVEGIRATVERGRIRRLDNNEYIDTVTISVGLAAHLAGETLEQLVGRADAALYAAKHGGRNRVCVAPAEAAGTLARAA